MRGARHYRPDVSTRLKKCSEHVGDDCNLCCAITPCAYCLELEIYGEPIAYGYAPESADHWTGTVDGHSFDAFWERNYLTDECEFIVELDSVEVYRRSCYEGQECRDSSDETGVAIGYDEATLRWIKHEPLPLPHIIGDEGCPTWFCGECECSCECVCVTIVEGYSGAVTRGELCNTSYPCDGPVWEGVIGDYDISLALGRDVYDQCVITATIDGVEQEPVAASGCGSMSATITLADETTITIACKICSCNPDVDDCCSPRCEPLFVGDDLIEYPGACDNPLPLTLAVDLTATPSIGSYTCFNGSGTLTFRTPLSTPSGTNCWEGEVTGSCLDCNSSTLNWTFKIVVCCDALLGHHTVSLVPISAICPATTLVSEDITTSSCDPFLISGCFPSFGGCMVCFGDSPSFTVCFQIYEVP